MHGLAGQPALDPVDRVAEHPVAELPARDAGADRSDLAGNVEPHDRRHRDPDPRHAAAGEHVVVVERRGANPQHHVALARHRVGEIRLVAQPTRAMLAQYHSLHRIIPACTRWRKTVASFETAAPRLLRMRIRSLMALRKYLILRSREAASRRTHDPRCELSHDD